MGTVIEAVARIRGEDATGGAFDSIARKIAAIDKAAKISVNVNKLGKELDRLEKAASAGTKVRELGERVSSARTAFRGAQVDVVDLARKIDVARGAVAKLSGGFVSLGNSKAIQEQAKSLQTLERAHEGAQRVVTRTAAAFRDQTAAWKDARSVAASHGINVSRLGAEQGRLRGGIDFAAADLLRQARAADARGTLLDRRPGIMAARTARADQAWAERQARAEQFHAARTGPRSEPREGGGLVDAGVGFGAGAAAKRVFEKATSTFAEMDDATRFQRVILGITPEQQKTLTAQAMRIGQDTSLRNADVVKGQTRIGSSLSDHLKTPGVIAAITQNASDYAQAMNVSLDDAAEAVQGRMLSLRYDMSTPEAAANSAKHAANRLVQFAKSSGANHNDIMGYGKFGNAPGHVAGFSEEMSDAMAAQLRRIGYEGSMAGNFVRAAATKLAVPTQKGLTALASAGIEHDDYVSRDKRMSVDNLEKVVSGRYGKKLNASQKRRIAGIFDDDDMVGKREEFVPAVSGILEETLAKRTKKGKVNAKDAESIAKAVNEFLSASAGATDIERLMKDVIRKGITPALGKYLFGQEHGGRAMALDLKTLEKDQATFRNTPDNRASDVGVKRNEGVSGARLRFQGSQETALNRVAQVWERELAVSYDAAGNALDRVSNLSDQALRAGTVALAASAGLLSLKGAAAAASLLGIPGARAVAAGAGRLLPGVGPAVGAAMAADAVGEGLTTIGGVAAGKYWAPTDETILQDLRQRREATEAKMAGIRDRTHPSMRGNFNPEVDRLEREVQELKNRIGAEDESVRESRRAAAFSRLPDPATLPRPGMTAPLPPPRPVIPEPRGEVVAKLDGRVPVDVTGKVEVEQKGQVTVVVSAAEGARIVSAFGSGGARVERGGSGRSMPGATNNAGRVPSLGGQGGV